MALDSSNTEVFAKVITSLARDAAQEVNGIRLAADKRSQKAVKVCFLPNEKVQVDMMISVAMGGSLPSKVAQLQESVKSQIESATKFRVNAVNVSVESVDLEQ